MSVLIRLLCLVVSLTICSGMMCREYGLFAHIGPVTVAPPYVTAVQGKLSIPGGVPGLRKEVTSNHFGRSVPPILMNL